MKYLRINRSIKSKFFLSMMFISICILTIIIIIMTNSSAQQNIDLGPKFSEIFGPKTQIHTTTQYASSEPSNVPTAPKSAGSDHVYESSTNIYNIATSSTENPLSISKKILEPSKYNYFVGNPIQVVVQITSTSTKTLDETHIMEHTDKALKIINCKKYIRSYYINDSLNPIFNDNYSYDDKTNTIYIPVMGLNPGESIVYTYTLKPTKPGIFDSSTVVRAIIKDPINIYPDYSGRLTIEAVNEVPKFDILLLDANQDAYSNNPIPFVYAIKLIEGSSINPYKCNISLIAPGDALDVSISKKFFGNRKIYTTNYTLINDTSVTYGKSGIFKLPAISINGLYSQADDKITVNNFWYELFWVLLLPLSLLIVGIFACYREFILKKEMEKLSKRMNELDEKFDDRMNRLESQGKYEEAIKALDEAIKLDPKYAASWYNKGLALHALGRNTEAEAAFSKAKELGFKSRS